MLNAREEQPGCVLVAFANFETVSSRELFGKQSNLPQGMRLKVPSREVGARAGGSRDDFEIFRIPVSHTKYDGSASHERGGYLLMWRGPIVGAHTDCKEYPLTAYYPEEQAGH